ncbi:hypothetical protein C2G38_2158831 [Gigaspora rosea]|uniref:Protein kinase domain-containing protein n=1 Tax=Gigaspora rosea TaxID=44941 RepID=A0A397W435_9GLOM|nr:hypothetical protein C2G38_2158831 [Gigaspora rosea]
MDKVVSGINKHFKRFNYEDIQEFQNLSNISDELSDVKRAYSKTNECHVVLKFLKKYNKDEYYNYFNREIENLRKIIVNENVIHFLDVTKEPFKKFLLYGASVLW